MPTILEKNKIVIKGWMNKNLRADIQSKSAIDILLDHIKDRLWEGKLVAPKVKPQSLGYKCIILKAGTGVGKSTVLPTQLYNTFYDTYHKNIIITEVTRITATDIPFSIIEWNKNIKMGLNIGYQTGTINKAPTKGILFCTNGVLLQFLKTLTDEQFCRRYQFVIIDEIHTRSVEIDLVLYYMKELLRRNYDKADCPILIGMSGTLEPKMFIDYFDIPKENYLEIEGSSFPIEDNFAKFDVANYHEYILNLVEKIHNDNILDVVNKQESRNIVVFMQGKAEIHDLCDSINKWNTALYLKNKRSSKVGGKTSSKVGGKTSSKVGGKIGVKKPIDNVAYYLAPIKVLSASIERGGKEYKDLYSHVDSVTVDIMKIDSAGELTDEILETVIASRKVIVGTNAIETGITITNLKYCIDNGYVKQVYFDPTISCRIMYDGPVTQASSTQRRGRIGREAPGVFYGCYTIDTFKKMNSVPYSEILRSDISLFVLNTLILQTGTKIENANPGDKGAFESNKFTKNFVVLKASNQFTASKLDFIQYPPSDSLKYSLEKLHMLGLIDHEYACTVFGYYASKFRKVRVENIRAILASYHLGANTLDIITIVAFVESMSVLGIKFNKYRPRNPLNVNKKYIEYYYRVLFMDEFLEFVFIFHDVILAIENNDDLEVFAKENGFDFDGLMKVITLRDEIIADMVQFGLNPYYNGLGAPRGKYNLVKLLNRDLSAGIEEVRKIKRCIYEGYRMNLCIYNESTRVYQCQSNNITITLDSMITKGVKKGNELIRPYRIIVGDIMLRESNYSTDSYLFMGTLVSVIDGYIDDIDQ